MGEYWPKVVQVHTESSEGQGPVFVTTAQASNFIE